MMTRNYNELIRLPTFEERFEYLRLAGRVGEETFGCDRYFNQAFYKSPEWRHLRNQAIVRDNGCDLAHKDRPIFGRIIVHHIIPITMEDIEFGRDCILDLNNVVCTSHNTSNAIHFGDASLLVQDYVERRKGDTCPWMNQY